jgi:diguanylate cyclase (GGDEF)-like protein
MIWKGWTDPQRYDPRVEAMHLVFAAVVTAAVAVLAERMGQLRARLVQQRTDLAQALQRIQSLATRDELTGLINRRAAMDGLRAELRRRDRSRPTLCIGLIDLDHFKRINDTHGHAAGDRALRGFADAAADVVRAPDLMARWGGEEFLLIMPATDEAEGAACLQRLRQRLAATPFDDVAPGLCLTFSAGVAACAGEDELDKAIDRADRAMYEAKRSGRDRVHRASRLQPGASVPATAEPA